MWFPVPPDAYGGIERVVSMLAEGLVALGHDVTLFASGDSRTSARLAAVFEQAPSEREAHGLPDLRHSLAAFVRAGEFDVLNDHSGPIAATVGAALDLPFLHSVHLPVGGELGDAYRDMLALFPSVAFSSVSLSQRAPRPEFPWIANCPNAVDLEAYPFEPRRGDYLLFLGRMSASKGCHRAIEVARAVGLPLKIAGKKRTARERAYFREVVEPALGPGAEYLGEVSHGEKVELLQGARTTLFPIDWDEPFGLVPIESMACGTPVVATRRGAVPEVVEHGRGGLVVNDYREMPAAVAEAESIEPAEGRRYVEERFAPERMVADYVQAYERLLEPRALGSAAGR